MPLRYFQSHHRADGSSDDAGKFVLLKRFIKNYTKFIDNSGWVLQPASASGADHAPPSGTYDDTTRATIRAQKYAAFFQDVCNALRHFSYAQAAGHLLLWNLQDDVDRRARHLHTSDTLVMTNTYGAFVSTETGAEVMHKFSWWNRCLHLCAQDFTTDRPRDEGGAEEEVVLMRKDLYCEKARELQRRGRYTL